MRKLLADIVATLGAKALLLPLGLASSIVIARVLQPEGKGVYTAVFTIAELALLVGSVGVGKAAVYHVARARGRDGELRTTAFWMSVLNGVVVCAALAVIALVVVPGWLPGIPGGALLLVVPLGVLALLRGLWEGFLRAQQRNLAVNGAALAFAAAFLLTLLGTWGAGALSTELAIGLRVAAAAVAAAVLLVLVRPARSGIGRPRISGHAARRLVGYGVPYAAIGLLQNASYRLDILLVQGFLGSAAVGQYSIAAGLGELLWYLPAAVGFVVFPRIAARAGTGAAAETAALTRWTLLLTVVGASVLGVAARPLVESLYGQAYLPAVEPLRLLLVGLVANVWYQVLSGYLLGRGRLKGLVAATAAGLVVNVVLNLVLIPRLGTAGAALSSSISYTLTGFLVLVLFSSRGGIRSRQLLLPSPTELRAALALARAQLPGRLKPA